MARSVAPSSSAPASDVTMPASNAATTSRPSTGSNPNKSGIHSVGIGTLRDSARNSCGTTLFADSPPRCTQFGEKSALEANMRLDPFQPLMYATNFLGHANYSLNPYAHAPRFFR